MQSVLLPKMSGFCSKGLPHLSGLLPMNERFHTLNPIKIQLQESSHPVNNQQRLGFHKTRHWRSRQGQ